MPGEWHSGSSYFSIRNITSHRLQTWRCWSLGDHKGHPHNSSWQLLWFNKVAKLLDIDAVYSPISIQVGQLADFRIHLQSEQNVHSQPDIQLIYSKIMVQVTP